MNSRYYAIEIHTYDCYQNNIIAVLENYFHIDYRPFFWTGFDFVRL